MTARLESLAPIAACHQPNFFPWLGYFHKLRWSNTFVFLDDVLIQKTRGSVTNRVAIAIAGKQEWISAPLDRSYSGHQEIRAVRFALADPWRDRFLSTLKMHYSKAPHYRALEGLLAGLIRNPEPMLAEYNMHAIEALAELLGLRPAIVRSSAYVVTGTSTLRLAELVAQVGARTYLAGGGATGYQEDDLFEARGVNVLYQRFAPPVYPRGQGPALAGLSVIDALLWLGIDGTRELLEAPPDDGVK